jgi:hypothetical protein
MIVTPPPIVLLLLSLRFFKVAISLVAFLDPVLVCTLFLRVPDMVSPVLRVVIPAILTVISIAISVFMAFLRRTC